MERRSASSEPPGPLPIKRLQESLINRIAAGEVIQRPAAALKELVENCLDAGATSIVVTVKEGGLKLLQIQDNGCGIRKADLPILAERFTTSKISTFSDLSKIATYGFRGEALASISHVARLTVMTKTKLENCAWKACYSDGKLTEPKPGQSSDPKPCAGNNGTTIIIEDLFYNTPTRLSALRSSSDEYSRILDVMTRYAVHNPEVAFVCKKIGSSSPDLSTPSFSDTPKAIRLLFGHSLAKELLNAQLSSADKTPSVDESNTTVDDPEAWTATTYFTNVNYQAKKTTFLLFINHRLVESPRTKRALESVYSGILPKGTFPFIYLSLQIDPRSVDVNVHPAKQEVHFLNEEAIIERIADGITEALAAQSNSRAFQYQTLLTGGVASENQLSLKKRKTKDRDSQQEDGEEDELSKEETPNVASGSSDVQRKTYSQHKVRTSLKDRTLDSMFPVANPAQMGSPGKGKGKVQDVSVGNSKLREIRESECFLNSIVKLRQRIEKGKHRHLAEILETHTFVGIVDLHKSLSVIQHSTKLYLINHNALAEELFYQLGVRQFGDFSRMKLEPPPSLRTLVSIAVKAEDEIEAVKLTKSDIVDRIVAILMERREMLAEYFSLNISEDGLVESLPMLLRDYTPSLDHLPEFLMRLGPQVNWTSEMECFDTFFRELAYFYTPGPPVHSSTTGGVVSNDADPDSDANGDVDEEDFGANAERWQLQHVLFPAIRRYLIPPKSLLVRDVVQVANLPDLYKVFERC